jgi:hypothetical protein
LLLTRRKSLHRADAGARGDRLLRPERSLTH